MADSILIAYHYNKARVFEVVLYTDLKLEHLRPPFLIRSRQNTAANQLALTPAYTRTLFSLIREAQRCIGIFLNMDLEAVRSAPVMHYIRCFYCLTVLLNLDVLCHSPHNDLQKILEAETLQIEDILVKWQRVCARAAGPQNCRSPAKFGIILANVRAWLDRDISGKGCEDLRPMTLLNVKEAAFPSQQDLQLPTTITSSEKSQEILLELGNVAHLIQPDIAADWTFQPCAQAADNTAAMDWTQPYHLTEDTRTTTAAGWSDQSAFNSFVPMELDESAIAFFEAMSSDVAHSFVPTSFQNADNDAFDSLMYQQIDEWGQRQARPA